MCAASQCTDRHFGNDAIGISLGISLRLGAAWIVYPRGQGLPGQAEGRMTDSTSKNNGPTASQPAVTGTTGRRAAIVGTIGALVVVGAIGWVLKSADIGVSSGDPAQPT